MFLREKSHEKFKIRAGLYEFGGSDSPGCLLACILPYTFTPY